jgi:branched-subunit amino acid transport protein
MTVWLTLLVAGAASYAFRLVPAVLVDRVGALGRVERISAYAVPVTFAAVAADAVVARAVAGTAGALDVLAPVAAAAVAVLAARRTGSSLAAIAAGLPVLWALTWAAGR